MKQRFNKKIFTASLFFRDIGYLIWNLPKFLAIRKNIDISNIFIEKIMTVTTAVNGCVYCAWLHAKKAIESGISDEEIKNMMKLQFQADATEFELEGLLYAQHYAETNRKPEPEMTEKLFNYYGEPTSSQIILLIRQINFGNLYGNTWDAVMSRFKGIPSPNSNIIFEICFLLLNFVFFIPVTILMKLEKKPNQDELKIKAKRTTPI